MTPTPQLFETYKTEAYSDFSKAENTAAYKAALEQVRSQLGHDYPLIIGSEKIETGEWLTSVNPSDIDVMVGRTAMAKRKDIEKAFNAAYQAYQDWSRLPMEHRARTLVKLAAVMRRRKWELCAWLTFESSKNFAEAEAEVAEAIDFAEYYARQALPLGDIIPGAAQYPGEENSSFLMPMGVGVVISPWNFPFAILAGMAIAPAVVGNCVIVKPSPDTPIIAQKFMECVEEAGFPAGVINLLTGADADLGDALVDHARTRFINFTGSLNTGLRINERAAKVQPGQNFIKRVYVEMGGKDALIVDETADLDYASSVAVASGFGFQGQKCSAMSRLIVIESVYDEVLKKFKEKTAALSLGMAEENKNVNAVINQKAVDKITHYIGIGKIEAKLEQGGNRAEDSVTKTRGYFIEPTIFSDVMQSATIACEEIFGPVVAVQKAKDFDHALQLANSTVYGLTGGLISKDRARLEKARREFAVGNLYLNRKITGALVGIQPFGGIRLSGSNAKAGGPDYLRLFMEMKTVSERF